MEQKEIILLLVGIVGVIFMGIAMTEKQRHKNAKRGMPKYINPPPPPQKPSEIVTTEDIKQAMKMCYLIGGIHKDRGLKTLGSQKSTVNRIYKRYIDKKYD